MAAAAVLALWLGASMKVERAHAVYATTSDGIVFYGPIGNTNPPFRLYSDGGNAFTSAANTVSGGAATSTIIRTSPTSTQEAIAGYITGNTLHVLCYNGVTWSDDWTVTVGASSGVATTTPYDIAYEQNTGDVMVLYATGAATTNELAYRTKTGGTSCGAASWAAASNFDVARTSGVIQWVKMASDVHPTSSLNYIAAAWADRANDLSAAIWNGTAWQAEPSAALETSLENVTAFQDVDDFDIVFESMSHDVFVAWANSAGTNGTNGHRYANCWANSASSTCVWGSAVTPSGPTDDATNIDISADPLSDYIAIAAIGNNASDSTYYMWTGAAVTGGIANNDASSGTPAAGTRMIATGWLNSGGTKRAIVMYNDGSANTEITGDDWAIGGTPTKHTDWPASFTNQAQKWLDVWVSPKNPDRLMFMSSDFKGDFYAYSLAMTPAAGLTWTQVDGGSGLDGDTGGGGNQPFSFSYWNWLPNLYGTIYSDQGTTNIGSGKTLAILVNGVTTTAATTTNTGIWMARTPTGLSAGNIVTVYLNNATTSEGTLVLRSAGYTGDGSSVNLYASSTIIRANDSSAFTNANFTTGDNGDTDVKYNVASSNLTVDSNFNLLVWAGTLYDPGGTVTTQGTGDFQVGTTSVAYLDTSSNTIARNISLNDTGGTGGTLYIDASTTVSGGSLLASTTANVLYSGGMTPTLTLSGTGLVTDGVGANATSTFYNVTTSGSGTTTFGTDDIKLANDLTVGTGTTLTGAKSVKVSGGDVTGDGTINFIGGTFLLEGTGFFGGNSNWTFASTTIGNSSNASTTAVGTGTITATSTLKITASSRFSAGGKTWSLTDSGSPLQIFGEFRASTSTISFEGTTNTFITPTSTYNLQFAPASGSPTYWLNASTTSLLVANNFTTGGAGAATVNADTYDPQFDVNGTFTIASGDTFVASASATTTLAGNFTNSGIFTHSNGTVKFDGSSQTLTGATTFYSFFATTSAQTIIFQANTTFTFAAGGTFTVLGGSGNQIVIRSDSYGDKWKAAVLGTSFVQYALLRDCGCNGSQQILVNDGTSNQNGSNDSCWQFTITTTTGGGGSGSGGSDGGGTAQTGGTPGGGSGSGGSDGGGGSQGGGGQGGGTGGGTP